MTVNGVDVSQAQRPDACDWAKCAEFAGFAGYKISSGREDAKPYRDTAAAQHRAGIEAAGIIGMPYHVLCLDNRAAEGMRPDVAGRVEACFAGKVLREIGGPSGQLPLALDLERYGDRDAAWNDAAVAAFVDEWAQQWGHMPGVYVGPKVWARRHTDELALELHSRGVMLWLARPDGVDVPEPSLRIPGWPWAIWQRSHTGEVEGMPTPLDINTYRGTLAELCARVVG